MSFTPTYVLPKEYYETSEDILVSRIQSSHKKDSDAYASIVSETKTKRKQKKKSSIKRFRLRASSLFLTYSNCSADLYTLLYFLEKKGHSLCINIDKYKLVYEKNTDNDLFHVHVFIKYTSVCYVNCSTFLDIHGYHGNYQGCKHVRHTLSYLSKTESIMARDYNISGITSDNLDIYFSETGEVISLDSKLILLAQQGKVSEAIELLKEQSPTRYLHNYSKILANLNSIFIKDNISFVKSDHSMEDFIIPPFINDHFTIIKKHIDNSIEDKPKPVFIFGSSGIGKTFLLMFIAKKFDLNVFIINNSEDFKTIPNGCHVLVLDDFNYNKFDRSTFLSLFDTKTKGLSVDVKHSNVFLSSNIHFFGIDNRSLTAISKPIFKSDSNYPLNRRVNQFYVNSSFFTTDYILSNEDYVFHSDASYIPPLLNTHYITSKGKFFPLRIYLLPKRYKDRGFKTYINKICEDEFYYTCEVSLSDANNEKLEFFRCNFFRDRKPHVVDLISICLKNPLIHCDPVHFLGYTNNKIRFFMFRIFNERFFDAIYTPIHEDFCSLTSSDLKRDYNGNSKFDIEVLLTVFWSNGQTNPRKCDQNAPFSPLFTLFLC